MNKWAELLLGLILVIVPVIVALQNYWGFGSSALVFLKGGLIWFVLFLGILFLLLGISDLKD